MKDNQYEVALNYKGFAILCEKSFIPFMDGNYMSAQSTLEDAIRLIDRYLDGTLAPTEFLIWRKTDEGGTGDE